MNWGSAFACFGDGVHRAMGFPRYRPMIRAVLAAVFPAMLSACTSGDMDMNDNGTTLPVEGVFWSPVFDASNTAVLTGVWGAGEADVFVVGGAGENGEIYRFDGTTWAGMTVPVRAPLQGVFGLAADDVFAVGDTGTALNYDGERWRALNSGTTDTLRDAWGATPDELWIVGGPSAEGEATILRYDGLAFARFGLPVLDRPVPVLYGVWGDGTNLYAVGSAGAVLQFDGATWTQAATGPAVNADFHAVWGTGPDNVVAVGGSATARIAVFDGRNWTAQQFLDVPGLRGVHMTEPDRAVVVGEGGYVGSFNPRTRELTDESSGASAALLSVWSDRPEAYYAVGGATTPMVAGVALVRTPEDPDLLVVEPQPAPEPVVPETSIELGQANEDVFVPIADGGDMQLFSFGQGGVHFFLRYRVTGFRANPNVTVTISVIRAEDFAPVVREFAQIEDMVEVEPGVNETQMNRLVRVDSIVSADVFDRDVLIVVTVTDNLDPAVTTTIGQRLHLLPPP